MRAYHGKVIPTKLEEMIKPEQTALIVVDVQNDFCLREGKTLCPEMISHLNALLLSARRNGVIIVYIQDTILQDRLSDSAPWIRHYMVGLNTDDPNIITEGAIEGSWGHMIVDEIKPKDNDLKILKYRSSAFYGTPLDMILRSNNITTTIITGVVTYGCVESTARDASNQYFVIVPEDCVWAGNKQLHEANLIIMKHRYDVVKSHEIVEIWDKQITIDKS